jgi:hypothetical protein
MLITQHIDSSHQQKRGFVGESSLEIIQRRFGRIAVLLISEVYQGKDLDKSINAYDFQHL